MVVLFIVTYGGVETGGSGCSMNWGPELLRATESGTKKFYARKEYQERSSI